MKVEMRVKPVTRYIVTKCVSSEKAEALDEVGTNPFSVTEIGEFPNQEMAQEVAIAMKEAIAKYDSSAVVSLSVLV